VSDEDAKLLKERTAAFAQRDESSRLLLEQAPDAIIVLDLDTNHIVEANPSAEKLFGYARDELLKHDLQEFYTPSQPDGLPVAQSFQAYIARAAAGEALAFERAIRNAQGQEFICEVRLNALPWAGRNLLRGSFVDISERAAAEKRLAQMESKYRGLLEAAPDAMVVVNTDGEIVLLNVQAERQFGYRRDELLGRKVESIIPEGFAERLVADSLRSAAEMLAQQIGTGIELTARRKDGSEFPIELMLSPLESTEGVLVTAAIRDITERKRVKDALRHAALYARRLIEASLDPFVIIDLEGRITDINEAAVVMTGVARDQLIGSEFSHYVAEPEHARAGFREILAKGTLRDLVPLTVRHVSGKIFHALFNGSLHRNEQGEAQSIVVAVHDITERIRAERALETLSRGNEALVRAADEGQLLQRMCDVIVEAGGYVMAWIGFAEHDEAKTVRPVAWAGHETGYLEAARISWADTEQGRGPTGTAIRTGEPQINRNFATNPQIAPWRAAALERGYASSVALPLKIDSGIIGALTIYATEADTFEGDEQRLLVELADDLSYGIGALRARADGEAASEALRNSMEATITALASTMELRDPYTAGHQRNVALLAAAIARDMGLSEHDIEGIRLAGVVHDVGKMSVPAEILSKPGKLTKIEFEFIKTHAQVGHDIVKGVVFPWPVAQTILQHHERLDGSGYPNGLKADAILIGARILAVADVVEAMTAHRPYRAALGLDAALAEVEAGKGTRYDAAAVDACRALFREGRFNFPS
jgi:PAS domain S-box-containing protein/putative nucleotidyltransferase with HDIG domain